MSDAATIPVMEADVREIKAALMRLEPVLARMDERLHAMNERLHAMSGRMQAMDGRMQVMDGRMQAMDGRMDHMTSIMATREDLARLEGGLRVEIADVRRELETKPSRASMWGMAIALVGLVVASIAAGAAYLPLVSRALRQ